MRSKSLSGWLIAAAVALTTAACSTDAPLSPRQTVPPQIRTGIIAPQRTFVINTQLRSTSLASVAYGHIQLKFQPGDPYIPTDPYRVTISGRIFNPNNEDLYSFAGIYSPIATSDGSPALFAFAITPPTDACRDVSLDGAFEIPSSLGRDLVASPSSFVIKFGATQGLLGFSPPSGHPEVPPNPIIPASSRCNVQVTG